MRSLVAASIADNAQLGADDGELDESQQSVRGNDQPKFPLGVQAIPRTGSLGMVQNHFF